MQLDPHPTVEFEVALPKQESEEVRVFRLRCNVLAEEELDDIKSIDRLKKLIVGWSGVEDTKGNPLKFNLKYIELLSRQGGFYGAFQTAFDHAVIFGSEKNL